jgi:sortase A
MNIQLKYLIIILTIVVVGVAFTTVAFSGKNIKTNHFEKDEISFDYPDSWQIVNQTRTSEIVGFNDSKANLNVSVNKWSIVSGYKPMENFTINGPDDQSGMKFVSHKTLDINGTKADENVYQFNESNTTYQRIEIWINKNNALYSIIFTTTDKDLNYKSPEIKAVTNNLTIKDSSQENTPIWGKVTIPSQGVTWDIRQDSVNYYGSVYHYSNSFFTGQNGTVGLLGHHTRYSAPFANINLLNTGDKVIITDYLTQRNYVYQVESNGDIKSDYKTNPLQFASGTYELTLVTCYPPGYEEAAYLTHCKLVSIEQIN